MAPAAKTNIEIDDLLREKPTTVIYPPEPVEEQPVHNPTQTMERERLTRYNQAVAKWKNDCNIIDRIGVLCGNKPWDIVDKKAQINGLLNQWNRRTKNTYQKIPPHQRREHHDTTFVGRIGADVHKTTERLI